MANPLVNKSWRDVTAFPAGSVGNDLASLLDEAEELVPVRTTTKRTRWNVLSDWIARLRSSGLLTVSEHAMVRSVLIPNL
jgi:hypothetical protein